jgi:hypothetical protein
MNKIKLLYDVVKVLREKDVLNGVATAEVQKDQVKIFYIKNEFQKNLLTMQTKANITTELDYEGKQVKHQSSTEFTNYCPGHGIHHRGFGHMRHAGRKCGSIKGKLSKIAFLLNLLNNMQAAEQENKTTLITLELSEIPEDIKILIQEKMNHADSYHEHDRNCFMKEFCTIEKGNFSFAMTVNKSYEIEKIVITFDGIQNKEQEQHVVNIVADLQLIQS